jgi:predicted nucleic acid-binding Zn ribbon protein
LLKPKILSQRKKNSPYYRNAEPTKLSSALDQMFEVYRIKGKADQTTIINLWEELMGKTIASRTTKMFFKNKILYVQLSSAPLKQELTMAKPKILQLLADKVGKEVVEDIIFR